MKIFCAKLFCYIYILLYIDKLKAKNMAPVTEWSTGGKLKWSHRGKISGKGRKLHQRLCLEKKNINILGLWTPLRLFPLERNWYRMDRRGMVVMPNVFTWTVCRNLLWLWSLLLHQVDPPPAPAARVSLLVLFTIQLIHF